MTVAKIHFVISNPPFGFIFRSFNQRENILFNQNGPAHGKGSFVELSENEHRNGERAKIAARLQEGGWL